MSSSAAFDRGLMVHLKGSGDLYRIRWHPNFVQLEPEMRYLIIPDLYFTDGSINSPSCPIALDMLKVKSTFATIRLRTDIAMWLPGHILVARVSPSSSGHRQ